MRTAENTRPNKRLDSLDFDRVGRRGLRPKADDVLYVGYGKDRKAITPIQSTKHIPGKERRFHLFDAIRILPVISIGGTKNFEAAIQQKIGGS